MVDMYTNISMQRAKKKEQKFRPYSTSFLILLQIDFLDLLLWWLCD